MSPLFVLALLFPSAQAFAPGPPTGAEPVYYRDFTIHGRAAFERSEAWQRLQRSQPDPWTAQVDERANRVFRMWGHRPLVDKDASRARVIDALRTFTAEHADLFRDDFAELPVGAAGYDPDFDTWYVDFDAHRAGLPVWRGAVTFRVKHGNLVLVGDESFGDTPLRGSFLLTDEAAVDVATTQGPTGRVEAFSPAVESMWLPRLERGLLVLRAVSVVRHQTLEPVGEWVSFVDAVSGELLASYNEVRYFQGTLSATYDNRFPGNGTLTDVVSGAVVTDGQNGTLTAADGSFNVADTGNYQAHFLSNVLRVEDRLGDQGLSFTQTNPIMTEANHSIAAIDTFVGLAQVRETFNQVVPNESWTTGPTQVTVNINDVCNAYYDGTLNFFRQGGGCNNTGRLADVIYHEWGHGFHAERIITGSFDGSLSEGAGDVVSLLMTGSPDMAPGFNPGAPNLRDLDNTNQFPQDVQPDAVHTNGLVFGGSMYHSFDAMRQAQGDAYAMSEMRQILSGLLTGGPNLQGAYAEALVADDDDGNLSNGTPHECFLGPGFDLHGIGPGTSTGTSPAGLVITHGPSAQVAAGVPIPITATVQGGGACGGEFEGGTATVRYRVDGGAWAVVPLVVVGESITGEVPAQPDGVFLEYVIDVAGSGPATTSPELGENAPYNTFVGEMIAVHCDDFESNDGGYLPSVVAGDAGDFERGAPAGRGGDPQTAHSGVNVWGNDLGFGDFNGQYEAGRVVRLSTPTHQLGHYEGAFLHYWRWLQIEDGVYDQAIIRANGNTVWSNHIGPGEEHHAEAQWVPQSVPLQTNGQVQVDFELSSDAGLQFGGWTVDDVCIMVPASTNNRLGVSDFLASEGGQDGITLTWTNPPHAPLAELRVLRKSGSCPTGANDGDVVFYDDAPTLGAPVSVVDAVPTTESYCYGVFPSDGTYSLGFAVSGWNIDEGFAATAATPDEVEESQNENNPEGMGPVDPMNPGVPGDGTGDGVVVLPELENGCSTSTRWPAGWLVLALLAARRRR